MGELRRRMRSKWNSKMKKAWGTRDVGQFFVIGPTDVATMPNHFYCPFCRKDVSVLTHGHHEILRYFQGNKLFPRDQRLRLEKPGWEVLDYEGKAMSPAEVERQQERIMGAPLVVRDGGALFLRTSLSTRLVLWTPVLWWWPKFPPSLKFCVSAEVTNWCTNSGRSSLCLLSKPTWMQRGHATRSCLVFPFARIVYESCVHSGCCVFSPSFSMACIHGLCLVASTGQNHTGAAAWSSKNKTRRYWSFFETGIKTSFGNFAC